MKTINPPASLSASDLRTYNAIFRHPLSHNLAWADVHTLLRHLGELHEEPNGNFKATRHGETLVLRPSRTKEVSEPSEIILLRHFIERSEKSKSSGNPVGVPSLLVIDHHQARVFHTTAHGTNPELIAHNEPSHSFHHPHKSKDFPRGQEKPDLNSYFEPVASALKNAGKIVIFGNGKGSGSEMDQFIDWFRIHHSHLATRIVGSAVVDEHHLTDAQLLAKAREYQTSPTSTTTMESNVA